MPRSSPLRSTSTGGPAAAAAGVGVAVVVQRGPAPRLRQSCDGVDGARARVLATAAAEVVAAVVVVMEEEGEEAGADSGPGD